MRIVFLLVFISITAFCHAQDGSELDRRNGFKDIKLLSDVSTLPGLEYWKPQKDKPQYDLYKSTKKAYDVIGDVKVYKLTVYTYRNLAYEIEVITEKDEKLFRSLEKAFGKIKFSMGSQISYWQGENVKLTYLPDGGKVKLTYTANGINKIIAADKKKAVDSLSSEF